MTPTPSRPGELTHLEPAVQVGRSTVSDAQHEERHVVELPAPPDGEAEAPGAPVQLHGVQLPFLRAGLAGDPRPPRPQGVAAAPARKVDWLTDWLMDWLID